jgi:hypothetical protein
VGRTRHGQAAKDTRPADIEIRLGHFLAKSAKPENNVRGIGILERYAKGRGDAQSYLAIALRGSDPARARTLLEQAVKTYPGHAVPTLADMLIKGEGGSADTKRALSLLRTKAQDVSAVKAALGRLYLDGRLMPRDAKEAVRLIRGDTIWSQESRLEVMGLLAANPEIEISNPNGFLYDRHGGCRTPRARCPAGADRPQAVQHPVRGSCRRLRAGRTRRSARPSLPGKLRYLELFCGI